MKFINLTKGGYATVSDKDYSFLRQFTWYEVVRERTSYAARSFGTRSTKRSVEYMHQAVNRRAHGHLPISVDHRDGWGLNNRRNNLRAATKLEQQFNRRANRHGSSRYVGVNFDKQTGQWMARVRINGRSKHLGRYPTEKEAAIVRDKAARKHYGRFAKQNITT